MSGAIRSKPLRSLSRAKASPSPYALPPTAHSRPTAVVDGPVALGQPSKPWSIAVGFQRPARYCATYLVASAAEQAECDAYLASLQRWWDDVHGAWRRRCARRRARHADLKLACEASCLPPPEPLVLPPAPAEPTTAEYPLPECVQRYVDRLLALPVAERAEQCRFGVGGHPGFVIARKLLLDNSQFAFAVSDVAVANYRFRVMSAAAAAERAKDEMGPNGETLATHDKVTEVQKCGGKGQTIKVVTWAVKPAQ